MGRLFALQAEAGITEEARHNWASGVLNRSVSSYTTLTEEDLDMLITDAQQIVSEPIEPTGEYEMCGAPCPDGWPCVVDAGHVDRGEDHAREDGLAWMVR